MAHNEIRVKKSREDEAVDNLANRLTELGGCKFLFPPKELFAGLQQLIHNQLNDIEEACRLQGKSASDYLPEDESEKVIYAEQLTQCAWQHFYEQAPAKFQGALAELIQESLPFAYPIYRERSGFSEEKINESRPDLADLQQNVLRRSILRLKGLRYRKREGVDGEENNEALSPFGRASAEIYNNLAFWTYDHVRIHELLRPYIYSMMAEAGGYNDPDHSSHLAAEDAAEFIWDNIDGAMQTMIYILVEYSMLLATPSLKQRNSKMFTPKQLREGQPSASDLKKIASRWLDPWFDVLTVKLSKRGRIPKDEFDKKAERIQFKKSVINAMLNVLDEQEKISQWRVSKILAKGNSRNRRDRTLYNCLKSLNLDWDKLKAEAEKIHQKKRTKN